MRRPKEDAQQTKEYIMDAAFESFFEQGFDGTSLESIAKIANVTRGAVYWHFADKKQLYREVVERTLGRADVVSACAHRLDVKLTYKQRIYEVFWFAMEERKEVDFVYKTMNFVSQREEFKDVLEKVQYEKIKLFRYFVEETSMHLREQNETGVIPETYAASLFLLFEGLFLTKNIAVGVKMGRKYIESYIDVIIGSIIKA